MAKRIRFGTRQKALPVVTMGLFLLPMAVRAQSGANACDLNLDGAVNTQDVSLAVNMALGLAPCTSTVLGPGVCNIVVVQRVTNAVLTGNCVTGSMHSATLNWTASTSSNVVGYNVYRATTAGGPYAKISSNLVAGTTYVDSNVVAGLTYYYVVTAVDSSNAESVNSNQATAVIPTP